MHADHMHGIDDLRASHPARAAPLPIYGPAETLDEIWRRSFATSSTTGIRPLPGTSKPEGKAHVPSKPGRTFSIGDVDDHAGGGAARAVIGLRLPHRTAWPT